MKKLFFILGIALVAIAGLAAQTAIKVAPTQAVVDFLVAQGADSAAIAAAKANAPDEALFLAPGAPSKEALAKILEIVNTPLLSTTFAHPTVPVATVPFDLRQSLNEVVLSELWKQMNQQGATEASMQIGDIVWTINSPSGSQPADE
jgi:hypothetical protein